MHSIPSGRKLSVLCILGAKMFFVNLEGNS